MSLFRALRMTTRIPQLLVFGVQSTLSNSLGFITHRLLGYFPTNNNNESESRNINLMDKKTQRQTFMIVGLGNFPHPDTRHSVGMRALDKFTGRLGLTWENVQGRQGGLLCKTEMDLTDGQTGDSEELMQIYLFKPKSLMNICGGNVARTAKSLGVMSDSIYLVHDELDLSLGKVSIKNGGSANGHRGVLSCVSDLKSSGLWPRETTDTDGIILPRLRIGIGRPTSKSQIVPYVLDSIPDHEVKATETAIEKGMDLVLRHIKDRVKRRRREEMRRQSADIT